MNKQIILKNLISYYTEQSYTHNYIAVFTFDGVVYMVIIGNDIFNTGIKLDKASRSAGYSIRFKPNKSDKINLLTKGAIALCSVEYFDEMVKNSKYNKGEIAEKIVTEHFGQTWEKDNVPFTDDGDITVDGIAYQIKYEKATFINEKQMMKMKAEGR